MVLAGLTSMLPSTGCAPKPLSMLTPLALLVVQARVVDAPAAMGFGAAEKLSILGRLGGGLELGTGPTPEMPSHVPPWLD